MRAIFRRRTLLARFGDKIGGDEGGGEDLPSPLRHNPPTSRHVGAQASDYRRPFSPHYLPLAQDVT